MVSSEFKAVVTGDICINKIQWVTKPKEEENYNWQDYPNVHSVSKPGESLLLSKLIANSIDGDVICPDIDTSDEGVLGGFLSSVAEVELYPKAEGDEEEVYRVKRFLGFSEPSDGNAKLLKIDNDLGDPDLVVLDDENNGFNVCPDYWPKAIREGNSDPIVIYKMNNPIDNNPLWKHLEQDHLENTIIIINSDDLRLKGVNISKSLSWERTAQDFVWQLNNNPNLAFLLNCRHLIVPFGLEGAIYYRNDDSVEYKLYFLPYAFEGETIKEELGKMYGLTSAFVSGLSKSILEMKCNRETLGMVIDEGIREGIAVSNKYYEEGFGSMTKDYQFPASHIFVCKQADRVKAEHVQDVRVPNYMDMNSDISWYILKDKSSANIAEIAQNIVVSGDKNVLKYVPVSKFGKLKSVDRTEIESYRSIRNLMTEYISVRNVARPLSIAVFGTPGSGKSFGVTEIAKSIAPKKIEKLDFNLSQFRSLSDLTNALHRVRDLALQEKIPLVFFDEFDSYFEGKLGWLKYLLAPMQDGEFREGDTIHPLGKAIFVFAGGTSSTYHDFCEDDFEFRDAKGPDFISRLRGYVNILGANRVSKDDQLYIIRRAMILRVLIERKVPHILDEFGNAKIDNGVLRALLKVSRYKHEARSIEAILEMSRLSDAKRWGQSQLPSKDQLKLHVEEEDFLRHLMHDAFYSEKIENIAMAIHDRYREINRDINPEYLVPWEDLDESLKDSSRDQARHITKALLSIHYDISYVKEDPKIMKFTDNELEILAEYEHNRWYYHKKETGWTYGPVKDSRRKMDPMLVPWDDLSRDKKNVIKEMVSVWPEILGECNFSIERLKFSLNEYY